MVELASLRVLYIFLPLFNRLSAKHRCLDFVPRSPSIFERYGD